MSNINQPPSISITSTTNAPTRTRKLSHSTSVPLSPLSPRPHHISSNGSTPLSDPDHEFHDVVWQDEESFLTGDKNSDRHILQHRYFKVGVAILGWYVFSLTISIYNNWMFDKKSLNLPFPILITSFHQLILSGLSYLTLYLKPSLYGSDYQERSKKKFDSRYFITRLFPCSLSSALDVGAANMSLRYIPLSIYTMIKSSSIAFVLLFGILTKLEKFSWNLLSIVVIMSIGVTLMAQKDHHASNSEEGETKTVGDYLFGSLLVVFSAMMSGLRWVLTQLLIIKSDEGLNNRDSEGSDDDQLEGKAKKRAKTHPVVTISQLAPSMFAVLFVVGAFVEGLEAFISNDIWHKNSLIHNFVLLLSPGVLVFFMTFFEFTILSLSHVLTLSIFGILKEVLTILLSVLIFKDHLSGVNLIGLGISLVDIIWYNYFRYMEKVQESDEVSGAYQEIEMEDVNIHK
ncbi:hypothetical protein WICPIJ_008275 [Wickerhamomyces pijperi]|uniref:GDP-mannose transporter n=1 Tax=Wickerhamomyces pijperi TaxID=599730 RepID=A0A9P8TIV7_WICPI|nr:hypothetical protein WICPIJ_008275 [Wickerhamomyces pijperi]